ncbi:MAG TPA: phosphate ABC transporter substrate-binding protein PstS [Candidatus Limnocylindrales bacterium]
MTRRPAARARRRITLPALVVSVVVGLIALAVAPPAMAAYAQIVGTGSTWSQNIVDQWTKDVIKNGVPVTYGGGGSSIGRQDFANYQNDFAISEIPYQGTDELGQADTSNGRAYAYLPIVAGGTSFTYHLEQGGQLMRDIRLSGQTIAKIFTGVITSWDDPQIKADNNGRSFPATPIVPVVRSDGSGTTAQFTLYLSKQYPDLWKACFAKGGLTSYFPRNCGKRTVAQAGSDQVMNFIDAKSGNGTIGYVEYSYPNNVGYPVVKVLNQSGNYVAPTQYNVAVALTKARIQTQNTDPTVYLTQILDDVYTNADPRAYPLSSYSYMIIPTGADDRRMTTAKRQTLVDFLFYGLCEGQGEAGPYGYSPLPLNLVQAGFDQIAKLKDADPNVQLQDRDATKCNNPTFVPGELTKNHLAEIAQMPQACDHQGQGPCLGSGQSGTGSNGSGSNGSSGSGAGSNGGGSNGSGSGEGGSTQPQGQPSGSAITVGDGGGPQYDAVTGEVVGDTTGSSGGSGNGSAQTGAAVTTTIAARSAGNPWLFGGLTVAEVLGVILVPGLLALRARRRAGVP